MPPVQELRRQYDKGRLDETFGRAGWRHEAEVFYRQRKSVWLVLALMIGLSAFWDNVWAWVAFFGIMAIYSAWAGVRIGVVVGVSFALWFLAGIERWLSPGSTGYRALGLWCIATLFLLVVWKADGVPHRLLDRHGGQDASHD